MSTSVSEAHPELSQVAALLERAVVAGEAAALVDPQPAPPQAGVSDHDLQRVLTAAVRLFAQRVEAGVLDSPFIAENGTALPSASEVCVAAIRMLDAVSVEVFELAMYKTWAAIAGGDAQSA